MSTELAPSPIDPAIIKQVLLQGDLKRLTDEQKLSFYTRVCESVGLNPLTQPFQYIVLNGKEVLYARREATEQLRRLHRVSITIPARELVDEVYVVTARATLPDGRTDENIGAVPLAGLKGEARANAMMKAETKSKRRVTLSICGLGMLDETEVESLPPTVAYKVEAPRESAVAAAADHLRVIPSADRESDPALPPAPELPPGAVTVKKIEAVETNNPNVPKYFITFSDGNVAETVNSFLASLAEAVAQADEPVTYQTRNTKKGVELKTLKRIEVNDQEPERQKEPERPPAGGPLPF